jgi:riboflavin biosynthesis pyrimidine reductase
MPLLRGYSSEMTVIASLVVGANLATTKGGSSRALSTEPDRARFLKRHRSASAFIIGRKSAAVESYKDSQIPIFVYSRSSTPLHFTHPMMQQITVDRNLRDITQLIDLRIAGDIVVEAGPTLLMAMIEEGVINYLELTISPIEGDGNFIDVENVLNYFHIESEESTEGTRLLSCRYKGDSSNRKYNP